MDGSLVVPRKRGCCCRSDDVDEEKYVAMHFDCLSVVIVSRSPWQSNGRLGNTDLVEVRLGMETFLT